MTRTWRAALTAAAACVMAACTLSACTSIGSTAGGSDGGPVDALKIGVFLDVTSWDPALADIGFDGPYLSAVYDPLVALDAESNPIPALATSWEYSPDFRTLTMDLRTGVTFDDGQAFDAAAAVANLEHLKAGARSGSTYRNVESVEAVDPDTIVIHLTEKDDALLYYMGLGRSWMASPAAIAADTLTQGPTGSGPYTYDTAASTSGSEYVFTKDADHWDAATYPFGTVALFPITDQTASLNAMLSGQLNVTYADAADIPRAEENGWNVASQVATWVGLQFADRTGEQLAPLGDPRVRQAISHAFDSAAILGSIGNGSGVATNQLFPAVGPVYDESMNGRYAVDLAKATQLMAEAGYPDGFAVTMPMSQPFQAWQPAVEQTLGQLGITITWTDLSMPDYQTNAPTFPMFIAVIAMDSNPMASVSTQIATEQWFNPRPAVQAYPEVAQLLTRINAATGDEQLELIRTLDAKLVDLAWQNVWYQADNTYFSVDGVTVTPLTGMMFPTLRFIQRG